MLQWHPLVAQLPQVPAAQLAIFVLVKDGKSLLKRERGREEERKRGKSDGGKGSRLFNLSLFALWNKHALFAVLGARVCQLFRRFGPERLHDLPGNLIRTFKVFRG